jgi:hypothetical protein
MIVITAPTGTTGRQVLEKVLRGNETIRVIVRDPRMPSVDAAPIGQPPADPGRLVGRASAGESCHWKVSTSKARPRRVGRDRREGPLALDLP